MGDTSASGSTPRSSSSGGGRGHRETLLGLVLDSTNPGSGVDDFLAALAGLTAERLSGPDRGVSCGITVNRPKRRRSEGGSTGERAASSLRIPVVLDEENSAIVSLYSPLADAFSADDVAAAQQVVAESAQALLLALRISQLSDSRDDLAAAMQSRTIIDMAIGAIMAQNRCGREGAFKILRNTSNNRNMKIRDVAATVVAAIAGDTDTSARFED